MSLHKVDSIQSTSDGATDFPQGIKISTSTAFSGFDSGTWTFTSSNLSSVDSVTTKIGSYIRINNVVFCSVSIPVDGVASTIGSFRITLPIARIDGNFSDTLTQASGTGVNGLGDAMRILPSTGEEKLILTATPSNGANNSYAITFMYHLTNIV